ncbi:hypothetical protein ACR6HW_08110 [Fusibacter sp. JL298sf-3]
MRLVVEGGWAAICLGHLCLQVLALELRLDRKTKKATDAQAESLVKRKIDSGLIAGEGLIGILLAVFAVAGLDVALGEDLGPIGALVFFTGLTFSLAYFSVFRKFER